MADFRASADPGPVLLQVLPDQRRAARRRRAAVASALALAAAGWVAGSLATAATQGGHAALGPFSYFPS